MDREEIEKKAKAAITAAGDMAAQGAEWLKSRDWKRYGENVRDAASGIKQRIYGKSGDDPPSDKGFGSFSAFRFMVTPALARILWFTGAYIVYPVTMYNILDAMNEYRVFFSEGAFWKVVLTSIACLMVFRLTLEMFVHVSRIHSSTKRTMELLEELVSMEKRGFGGAADEKDPADKAKEKDGAVV